MNTVSPTNALSKIIVASENTVKISAVQEVFSSYERFKYLSIAYYTVESGVSEQPFTLEETVTGAKLRAERAYHPSSLSIGLESGLMVIPATDDEYMNVCICSIYDGKKHHIGMSCGFRIPKQVISQITEHCIDHNEAMKICQFTDNPRLGSSEGSIGLFTKGRLTRKDCCKQSIITALVSIDVVHYFTEQL